LSKRKPHNPCRVCGLNEQSCVCEHFQSLSLQTRVDLIVHYKELKRTSNTGRLIEPLLSNHGIWVRGQINESLDYKSILKPHHTPILLYPSDDSLVLSRDKLETLKIKNKPLQLLVPDGNWRQASKVHYRVQEFKGIPRVTLPRGVENRETLLRKEIKEGGMSTLEAIAHVLGVIEGSKVKDHLLKALEIKQLKQLELRGVSVP